MAMTSEWKGRGASVVRLTLFGLGAVGAVWVGFLAVDAAEAGRWLQRYGYYAMGLTFGWWGWALAAMAREARGVGEWGRGSWGRVLREHGWAWAVGGGLALVAWASVPFSTKVLYDEVVLQATAKNIHLMREFGTMVRGYEIDGVFRSLEVYVDKRPFFYPFLVALVHDLTGERLSNGFWLNAFLWPVVAGLAYAVFLRFGSKRAALAALGCFVACPLLAQNANGAGMDLLNVAMMLAAMGVALLYLERPGEQRLAGLILTVVLLAQTRYESALFVLAGALVVLEGWRRAGRVILPVAAVLAPWLLVPVALHNTYLSGTPVLWELSEDIESRFEARHFWGNVGHGLTFLFSFSGRLLNAWWLSVTGSLAMAGLLIYGVARWRRWRAFPGNGVVAVAFGLAVAGNLGLLMFYFWGQLDDPIVSRLILPFHVMLGVAVAAFLGRVERWSESGARWAGWVLAGALLAYVSFGLKATAYHLTINQLAEEMDWELAWLGQRAERPGLIITNKSAIAWLAAGVPSISTGRANFSQDRMVYHFEAGSFGEVLVMQYFRSRTEEGEWVLDPTDALTAAYGLKPVVERRFGGRLLRISRVVEMRWPPPEEEGAEADTGEEAGEVATGSAEGDPG